ncbi:restriction endonuclease subunit S [Streptomyces radicis]|nr:restriction endonuclease subunit S [Streptomyces radicis]
MAEMIRVLARQERSIEASIDKLRKLRQGILLTVMGSLGGGKLPAGWGRVALNEVVPQVEYGISEALDNDPHGIPVLRMNNLHDGRPLLDELRYCSTPVPNRLEMKHGDVLFNRTNSIDHVGKAGLWRGEIPRATFASYLVRVNPDPTRLMPEYLVEWLMHPLIRQRVRSISTVAVQQVNVNPTRLCELEIEMPLDLAGQQRIVDALHSCDEQIQKERAELDKLRAMKVGLVDDLMGEAA